MTLLAFHAAAQIDPLPSPAGGIRAVAGLVIVLGLLFTLAWMARRGKLRFPGGRARALVSVEAAVPLGDRRSLVVVAVEGRRLLLGLTPAQVSFVTELAAAPAAEFQARRRPAPRATGLRIMKKPLLRLLLVVALVLVAAPVLAQAPSKVDLKVDGIGSVSAPLQLVLVLTLLSFLPAILVTMTSFTRIVIVFHFLRQALGTQEVPSNQILVGLALFLTLFIMAPVAERINTQAVQPVVAGSIDVGEAMTRATPPLREFMLKQTRETDLALFVEAAKANRPVTPADLPMTVVIPAYVISEIKTGFQMGFFIFVPVHPDRPRRLDHAALDGDAAAAAGDDRAAVQAAAVRDDRRLGAGRRVAGQELRVRTDRA